MASNNASKKIQYHIRPNPVISLLPLGLIYCLGEPKTGVREMKFDSSCSFNTFLNSHVRVTVECIFLDLTNVDG